MAAPLRNENSKTKPPEDLSVNLTVVMPRSLVTRIDDARKNAHFECNRSAYIREVLERAL